MNRFTCLLSLWTGILSIGTLSAQETTKSPFATARSVWHFQDLKSNDPSQELKLHGEGKVGIPLEGKDREDSLARGGDGKIAHLNGGWLQGSRQWSPGRDQFTALIRLRCPSPSLWSTRGFFTKGGGHDGLLFNFFSHDFQQGPQGMRVGCEIGIEGKPGLGGQVTAPVAQIGATHWHDYLIRYDGRELILFVDGVALDRKAVSGKLRINDRFPIAIGAGGPDDTPFPCQIDHAAIWDLALNDAEIVALSGGSREIEKKQKAFAAYQAPKPGPSTTELVNRYRDLKKQYQQDPHRPRYHFLHPEEGEIMPGDPNGAIWWKGKYHLFYIFQRLQETEPQTVHAWGHASSIDLIHWEHHPTALDVGPRDPDRGIFSGNAFINKEGKPTILYHGVGIGNSIATSQDDQLIHWVKSPGNPIVPSPRKGEANYGKYDSWDPHGWLEGNSYFAIFGGNPGSGTTATLFQGPELNQLKYVGPFIKNDPWSQPGEDISCPDFFPLKNKHILVCISHMRGARYFVGQWKDQTFTPLNHGRMNWPGGAFFAPETLLDEKGRRILWAWCLDERPPSTRIASGWSGVMSLPRILDLDPEGTLLIEPAPELDRLRFHPRQMDSFAVPANTEVPLKGISGDQLELQMELAPGEAKEFGVKVRRSPDGQEETTILYDPTRGTIKIDLGKSTLDPQIRYRSWSIVPPPNPEDANRKVTAQEAPLNLKPGETLKLRIYLDHSMVEVFANGRQCLTQRVWPTHSDATGISVFSKGGTTKVQALRAWDISSSNSF